MSQLLFFLDVPATRHGDAADTMGAPTRVPGEVDPPPIRFRDRTLRARKAFLGSTQRTCSPEETLDRVRPHLRTCGITRIADVTGLDRIHHIPVVLAMRPNSLTLANSAGKGFTTIAATVSAVMEGIELHHAEELTPPCWEATFTQTAADREHLRLGDLPLTKYSVFHPELLMRWVEAYDLVSGCPVAVPVDLVGMGMAPRDSRPVHRSIGLNLQSGSNGLASGNHLLEAICAGLYEVIERDAIAMATLAGGDLPRMSDRRVDLSRVPYRRVQQLFTDLTATAVAVKLYDVSSDLRVPTFVAKIVDTEYRGLGQFKGYGCHLDPEVAMIRAITEAVQARTVYIAGSRDDLMRNEHALMRRSDNDVSFQRFLTGPATPAHQPSGSTTTEPAGCTATFEGDLAVLIERVRGVGLRQVLVVDLTDQVMGIPVVRVIVPGLEGYMFPTYAPGPRARAAMAGQSAPLAAEMSQP